MSRTHVPSLALFYKIVKVLRSIDYMNAVALRRAVDIDTVSPVLYNP